MRCKWKLQYIHPSILRSIRRARNLAYKKFSFIKLPKAFILKSKEMKKNEIN